MLKINENIYRLTMPYKDIFTTVYAIKTECGVLIFDSGSYDEDIETYIQHILTAHDYHPYGYSYVGEDAVQKALDVCIDPLYKIRDLILENPDADDEKICMLYNSSETPTLGAHVVSAIRAADSLY